MLALMKRLTNSVLGKIVVMIIVIGMAFWGVDGIVNQIRNGLGANNVQSGETRSKRRLQQFQRGGVTAAKEVDRRAGFAR